MQTFLDPSPLMRVKSLELRARMVMEGFWKGIHRSPYHGFSVEFSEYRPYVRGDDPRFIDWKVMARNDRAYIKKFEDETNLRAHLLLDRSRSMTYRSGEYSKADYAATFAATLAYFLMGQQDAVGLVTFDTEVRAMIPAGITDSVIAGRIRNLKLSRFTVNPACPFGPMPIDGSTPRFTAKMTTSTMPSQ